MSEADDHAMQAARFLSDCLDGTEAGSYKLAKFTILAFQQADKLVATEARVLELERELTEVLCFAPRCKQCGKACEPRRWVYAVPTCYACLPPPEPLERKS